MALPTSTNNVTVRKLSSTLDSYNTKVNTKLSGKADKVSGATANNFAGLDANGNLKDSGKKASDFATSSQGSKADSAIQGIKINGTLQTPDTNKVVDITKTALGLNNVTNDAQVKRTEMGVANGVATLDENGKIPTSQIPGSYDDVKEGYYYNGKFYVESSHTTEIPAASDKVYVDIPNNTTYRWSGTQYVKIGSDLALGETSSTAYRGDRGKIAYDHSQVTSGNPHNVTKSEVGLGSVVNTGDSATPVSGGTTKFTTGGAYTELAKKADKTSTVTNVAWDSTNKKLTKTINGTTSDIVTAATLKAAMALDNVDNTSDATKKTNFTGTIANGNTGFVTGGDVYTAIANAIAADKVIYFVYGDSLCTYANIVAAWQAGNAVVLVVTDTDSEIQHFYFLIDVRTTGSSTKYVRFGGFLNKTQMRTYYCTSGDAWTTSLDTFKTAQTAVSDPVASSSTSSTFIDSISQDENGVITATKKTLPAVNKVKATAKTDNVNYKILATSSASPTSGGNTETVYDTDITLNPSTNTITANLAGNASTASKIQTAAKIGDSNKGVYVAADGTVTACSHSVDKDVPSDAVFTDQSVTAVGNHYAPSEDSGAQKDATGGTATQLPTSSSGSLVQVVTGVKMDAKGHVTGVVSKGLWSPNDNTTYTNAKLGQGYSATATNTSGTFAVTLSNYVLENGGIIAVKFGADVPASAKLNVNSKGAKDVYYRGAAIAAGVIQNGDTAFFIYDSGTTRYQLLGVDRSCAEMSDTEVSDLINALS